MGKLDDFTQQKNRNRRLGFDILIDMGTFDSICIERQLPVLRLNRVPVHSTNDYSWTEI